jgi:hypothetical protein
MQVSTLVHLLYKATLDRHLRFVRMWKKTRKQKNPQLFHSGVQIWKGCIDELHLRMIFFVTIKNDDDDDNDVLLLSSSSSSLSNDDNNNNNVLCSIFFLVPDQVRACNLHTNLAWDQKN